MKMFWGVIAAAAAITALIIAGTSVLMKDLDARRGNDKKKEVQSTFYVYDYSSSTENVLTTGTNK